jgi:ubiquinone/menaquinone biosynthesis C-methylase UbiE
MIWVPVIDGYYAPHPEDPSWRRTSSRLKRGTGANRCTTSTTPTGTTGSSPPSPRCCSSRSGWPPHRSLLAVGCGCGAVTLAAAGIAGSAVGIDISVPLTEVASERASTARIDNVEFVVADAQTHAFPSGTFDLVVSQFGLMFFDDPVGAFSNLRRSLAPDGRLAFVSWQGLPANEWLTVIANEVAKRAEVPEFGGLARGPGMFALKDQEETTGLLEAAGFTDVAFEALAPTILIGGGGTMDQSMDFLLGMGMVRGLVGLAGTGPHDEVVEAVRASLTERYEPGVGLRFGAAAWTVTACG